MLTRRDFLRLAGGASAATLLPLDGAMAAPEPFAARLTIPPVLRPTGRKNGADLYEITMRYGSVEVLPGKRTRIWGFNGRWPGPTIKVTKGRPVVVRQINRLRAPTSVHLHGGHVRPQDDGHPLDVIRPGHAKDYHYPNEQPAATLWYHDHAHHETSRNVYMGLAGLYIIEDPAEKDLNLPSGRFDIPLIIQDRKFRRDGSLRFRDHPNEVLGDVYTVNGRPVPHLEVANRKYRFRILNGSNTRNYTLKLDSGLPLTQIGSDGGLLPAPATVPSIPLWPAERVEVVIDFSQYPIGSSVVLQDQFGPTPLDTRPVMRFDVAREAEDPSEVPSTLRAIERLEPGPVERTFELSLDGATGRWLINGKPFRADRIDADPKLGDTEVWKFDNISNATHPMHIHLEMFQVLDRDGIPAGNGETGWKDTVRVASGETVRVAIRFQDYTGRYVFHCHNLAHEDHIMMGQMKVVR